MQNKQWQYFPRGLQQPENGFRFSLDALLLACFPRMRKGERVIDLGCGCGVVGLGLIINNPNMDLQVKGIDISNQLVEAACNNARNLDLQEQYSAISLDLKDIRTSGQIPAQAFDLVLFNPPYRTMQQGRVSPRTNRNQARFEKDATLQDFVHCSAYILRNKGRLCLIYLAERLVHGLEVLLSHGLQTKRLRFIHAREDDQAKTVLIEAIKGSKAGTVIESPLVLYSGGNNSNQLSEKALQFCPFLSCNQKRGA